MWPEVAEGIMERIQNEKSRIKVHEKVKNELHRRGVLQGLFKRYNRGWASERLGLLLINYWFNSH